MARTGECVCLCVCACVCICVCPGLGADSFVRRSPPTGIGAAIATNLASKGANIVISYLTESSDAPAKELAEKGEIMIAKNSAEEELVY